MTSNLDKSELFNPKATLHTSGWREAKQIAVLIWILGVIFMVVVDYSPIPKFIMIFLVLSAGVFSGLLIQRWISGMDERRRVKHGERDRTNRSEENRKKIEAAKASGAFNRWEED